jgi:hypothetical protein
MCSFLLGAPSPSVHCGFAANLKFCSPPGIGCIKLEKGVRWQAIGKLCLLGGVVAEGWNGEGSFERTLSRLNGIL